MRINKSNIEKLAPTNKDQFYWDEAMPGFGVKVTPAGKRIFVFQTRFKGKPKRFTIGAFGFPWTADMARQEAFRIMHSLATGGDGASGVVYRPPELTVSALAERYWTTAISHKKSTTIANEEGLLRAHITPLLGNRIVSDLTREDVQAFMTDVAKGKTQSDRKTIARGRAIVSGGKSSANRSVAILSSMLSFAVENHIVTQNVASGIKHFRLKRHTRYLTDQELLKLGQVMRDLEGEGISYFAIAAIRFLLLTGCRKNEALRIERDWIDFRNNVVSLPDSKTGQKVLMIGKEAASILAKAAAKSSFPLVFPSADGRTSVSTAKIWASIKVRAGLRDLRLHDLRHNFASTAVSSGQSLYLVGKLLGHSQSSTTERYAHLSSNPMQLAADETAARLSRSLEGTQEAAERPT